jgi:glycosyltransferase involved in cell wall biosynthesis
LRVLVFHGYLLHGTGSNIYNASLGEALVAAGHELHLLCQDREPLDLPWVDATADWAGGSLAVQVRREPVRATVYRPDIAGLLPVYVADRYDGIEARPFPELSDEELERYLERNVAAVREVAGRVDPDVALANHLVMGPLILARALEGTGVPYAVKIHGSALEYTVKPYPRFLPHAREGLAGARGILVGSRHTGESLWRAMDDESVRARTRLGPPGVDVERFAPREPGAAAAGLAALRERLAGIETNPSDTSSFARDTAEAVRALDTIDARRDRLVVFVGKLIGSKGVELLLAAWPLVLARVPEARLLIVGFGAFRRGLEQLAKDIEDSDLEAILAATNEHGAPLPYLHEFAASFDEDVPDPYWAMAERMTRRIAWAGRLDHDELADLLPAAEAMAVPSTFPEAFGMVAAEAAACGALPVVSRHSGLAEVARSLAGEVPAPARDWLAFDLGPGAVRELADHLASWLEAPEDVRTAARDALVHVARERYGWGGVARTVIAAAQGRLDELPDP